MKLVEILARELKAWPEGVKKITQSTVDGELYNAGYSGSDQKALKPRVIIERFHDQKGYPLVTKADWEAERAKLKAPKANGDGWVRNRGRVVTCPADPGVLIDVKWRGGEIDLAQYPSSFNFSHNGTSGDIMAYRLHKPAEQPVRSGIVDQLQEQCAGLAKSAESLKEAGPIEWRDRIRELDTQRAEVEATDQRQVSKITQERESLVQKLAGEGLALVEVVVQPVEDMSDWRNWKYGDVLLCEGSQSSHYTSGHLYTFICISPSGSARTVTDNRGVENGLAPQFFKWHSRPAT
jgi:hypothetical protein